VAQPKERGGVGWPAADRVTPWRESDRAPPGRGGAAVRFADQAEKEALAGTMTRKAYRKGERAGRRRREAQLASNHPPPASSGVAPQRGSEIEMSAAGARDYFGDSSLSPDRARWARCAPWPSPWSTKWGRPPGQADAREARIAEEISVTLSRRAKSGTSGLRTSTALPHALHFRAGLPAFAAVRRPMDR